MALLELMTEGIAQYFKIQEQLLKFPQCLHVLFFFFFKYPVDFFLSVSEYRIAV